jgi:hypothetical protein
MAGAQWVMHAPLDEVDMKKLPRKKLVLTTVAIRQLTTATGGQNPDGKLCSENASGCGGIEHTSAQAVCGTGMCPQ